MESPMQKHRKLAAIMLTYIVGYTALMSKNEENALRILQKNRDIVKLLVGQFNGELLKEMGDSNLCSVLRQNNVDHFTPKLKRVVVII